jgi:hypothetical protein
MILKEAYKLLRHIQQLSLVSIKNQYNQNTKKAFSKSIIPNNNFNVSMVIEIVQQFLNYLEPILYLDKKVFRSYIVQKFKSYEYIRCELLYNVVKYVR